MFELECNITLQPQQQKFKMNYLHLIYQSDHRLFTQKSLDLAPFHYIKSSHYFQIVTLYQILITKLTWYIWTMSYMYHNSHTSTKFNKFRCIMLKSSQLCMLGNK